MPIKHSKIYKISVNLCCVKIVYIKHYFSYTKTKNQINFIKYLLILHTISSFSLIIYFSVNLKITEFLFLAPKSTNY